MPELAQWMIDGGATFFDAAGNPTRPDGTPVIDRGGMLGQMAQQVGAPEWVQPPELGRGGPPMQEQPTPQQQALFGHFGEAASEQAGRSLLDYLAAQDFPDAPAVPNFHPPMTAAAEAFMDRQRFPVDPNRIVFNGSGFALDSQWGPDLFGGQLPLSLNELPRSLQPLLGPSIAQHYANTQAQGWAPSWSGFFAPPAPVQQPTEKTWPGATYFDAWHRPIGMIQAFSS